MKSVGSEFLTLAMVLSVPIGIVAVFPFGAFGFKAAEGVRRPVRTAFVEITPEAERKALRAIRVSWREKIGGSRRLQADLFCMELPEDERISVLSVRDRNHPPSPPEIRRTRTPFLPSLKASPPQPIAASAEPEQPAFPREELLKMN